MPTRRAASPMRCAALASTCGLIKRSCAIRMKGEFLQSVRARWPRDSRRTGMEKMSSSIREYPCNPWSIGLNNHRGLSLNMHASREHDLTARNAKSAEKSLRALRSLHCDPSTCTQAASTLLRVRPKPIDHGFHGSTRIKPRLLLVGLYPCSSVRSVVKISLKFDCGGGARGSLRLIESVSIRLWLRRAVLSVLEAHV